jgi:phosphatidate cytidylyltransferase
VPLLVVVIIFAPEWAIASITALVAVFAAREFYKLTTQKIEQSLIFIGYILILTFVANGYFKNEDYFKNEYTGYLLAATFIIPLVWLLFRFNRETLLIKWAWTLTGILYIGWLLSHYVAMRRFENGESWLIITLFTTFACDTAAYFVGRAWGKHKMAPSISPGKTWEGAAGGLFGAALAAVILHIILDAVGKPLPLEYGWVVLMGILIGICAQLGDLTESLLKRNAGVKDTGKLLPGHGGILDRIDSVIFTGVVVYYYALYVGELA